MYQLIGKCLKLKDDFYRVGRALKPSAIIDLEKIALQCGTYCGADVQNSSRIDVVCMQGAADSETSSKAIIFSQKT